MAFGKPCGELPDDMVTFTASGGEPITMTRHEVSRLSATAYGNLWRDIINGLAGCLLQASNDMQSPAGQRLLELIVEARNLKKTLGFMRPDTLAEYAKQAALQHGPPPPELWRSIADSLTLSATQRQDCVLLRNEAFRSMGALMRQRSELARSLEFENFTDLEAHSAPTNDYLNSSSAAAQLHTMLMEENNFTGQLMMTLFGKILTPLQTAHCHVLAFPYELNALKLVDSVAAATAGGVPPASELIQRGAAEQVLTPLYAAVTWTAAELSSAKASCCGDLLPQIQA
jgi:hypothetical protein